MSLTLVLFWVTFGLFAADVLIGKLGVITGGAVHQMLRDVPHFLLLALSAAFLTAEALRREARRNRERPQAEPPSGGDQKAR